MVAGCATNLCDTGSIHTNSEPRKKNPFLLLCLKHCFTRVQLFHYQPGQCRVCVLVPVYVRKYALSFYADVGKLEFVNCTDWLISCFLVHLSPVLIFLSI